MKKCPFCSEEIQEDAQKCRFCGEWLNDKAERVGGDVQGSGSVDARAITRGIKQKEQDDLGRGCFGFILVIISVAIGFWAHWIVGVVVFLVGMVFLTKWYYKE